MPHIRDTGPLDTALTGTELVPVQEAVGGAGSTKHTTVQAFADFIGAGPNGPAGPGVAAGGTAAQVLAKIDSADYNTHWVTPAAAMSATFAVVTADTTGAVDAASAFTTADALTADKYIPAGTYKFSSNVTLSGRYWFEKGAVLKPDANKTIVLSGAVIAQSSQIFDVTTSGANVHLDGFAPIARPEWWGAKGDWQQVSDGALTSGSLVLTSASGKFTAADQGKGIGVALVFAGSGAAPTTFTTTIASYQSPTQVTLTNAAAYNGATAYTPGMFVSFGGTLYVCKAAVTGGTGPGVDTAHWFAAVTVSGGTVQWWTDDRFAIQRCLSSVGHALNPVVEFAGKTYVVARQGTTGFSIDCSRVSAADGTITSGLTTISSATMRFTPADEGMPILGTGAGSNNRIAHVTSPTTAVMLNAAVSSSSTTTFSIPLSNMQIRGVRGQTWLKHPTGMPNASVSLLRLFQSDNVTIRDMGFDGNWQSGSDVSVVTGINHLGQTDPKNYLAFVGGATNLTFDHCKFRQAYGDFVEITQGSGVVPTAEVSKNIRLLFCDGDISARNAVTAGGYADGIELEGCRFTNIHTQSFDTEPSGAGIYVRNVHLHNSYFGSTVSISGANQSLPQDSSYAQHYRVTDCVIHGGILILQARDVIIKGCNIVQDAATASGSAVLIEYFCDDIWILDNNIYRSSDAFSPNEGAIDVVVALSGSASYKPENVTVRGNHIFARNGRHGVTVRGTGMATPWNSAVTYVLGSPVRYNSVTYRATGTSTNSAPDTLVGWMVWPETDGDASGGIVTVADNTIDCRDDGAGAGGHGVYLSAGNNCTRVAVLNNKIRAANSRGVFLATAGTTSLIKYLFVEIVGNKAWDAQPAPTCLSTVHLENPRWVTQLIVDNNRAADGVAAALTGATSGYWQTSGDLVPNFVGFGDPNTVVPGAKGSRYQRVDGVANASTYRNEDGTNTGWVPDSAVPANATQHALFIKATDQAVNSSTTGVTLVDCAGMGFAIAANEQWVYEFVFYYDAATGGDLKVAVTVPGGATLSTWGVHGPQENSADATFTALNTLSTNAGSTAVVGGIGAGSSRPVAIVKGVVKNGANAGTVQLQMAQGTANAADTRVFAGAHGHGHRVFPA